MTQWTAAPVLTDRAAVVKLIDATTTKTGLKVECALDIRTYEKRIFERLRDEYGFTGGYTIVKDYVRACRQRTREMFVPARAERTIQRVSLQGATRRQISVDAPIRAPA